MRLDPRELRGLKRRDPRLAAAIRCTPAYPGFPSGSPRLSRYESLAKAVVYQQLAGKAAATIWGRVRALGGGKLPAPPDLLAMEDGDLRAAGLSRAKLAALRDLAAHVDDGRLRLRSIHRHSDEEVIDLLVQVRGVGPWTAQMFLMFQLGRLDVMPTHDLGIQEGLKRLDDLDRRPDPSEVAARAEVWAPLRSVASWHLWRLTELSEQALRTSVR